jgi:cytochrome c-type biogenesis protein CcmH/NrfF
MIDQGYSDERIQDEFVARYGAAILMTPDGKRGQWLFTMPAAFLLLAALGATWFLRRMLRRAPAPRLVSAPPIDIDEDELDW